MANKNLKSIKFPGLTDTYVIADPTLTKSGAAADSKVTGDALATKANIDGSYADLTAGNAEQIVSSIRANDKVPYLFRPSGGYTDIGDREYINGIVGVSLPWNQLVQNGNFADTSHWLAYSDGRASLTATDNKLVQTFSGTATASTFLYGLKQGSVLKDRSHKFLFSITAKPSFATTMRVELGGGGKHTSDTISANSTKTISFVSSASEYDYSVLVYPLSGAYNVDITGETIEYSNAQVFDLTQMFGSTIADYIYSLEQSNTGAGVAWFKKLFPKPYYPYDSGSLKSVEGLVSHDMTGFNQWDEETESGYINPQTGAETTDTAKIRMKNYMPVLPNTTYYKKGTTAFWNVYFDADKNYIGYNDASVNTTFTTPANAYYIRSGFETGYGTIYKHDVCINLSWDGSRNGEYEPYVKHSYPLDSDLTLRGIPKLDANNNLYYDGDTYEPDGTVTRKYGIVDLGTLTWNYNSDYTTFWSNGISSLVKHRSGIPNIMCAKYRAVSMSDRMSIDKGIAIGYAFVANGINIRDSTYTDAATFKTAMSGVYLVYELATPTTETADPYQQTQIVDDFGTEEYVTDSIVPVGHDTDYPVNLVAKLEMSPNSPSGDGDYIVRQTNGENSYVPLVIEDALPTIPSTAGSYKLTVTVAEGSDPVLSWEAE